jgi:ABC-type Fe3+-hydroxamate transport system substrate-binding protein
VTLAPSLGELVAQMLGTDLRRLVGVSEYSDFPTVLQTVSSIGPYHHFNMERVVALKPDLVLATLDGNDKDQVLQLRQFGVPVVTVRTEVLSDVGLSFRLVAEALGLASVGVQMANQFELGIEQLRIKYRKKSIQRVLLQVGESPLIVAGGRSFLTEVLAVLGLQNIFQDRSLSYFRPSVENVIQQDPDWILVAVLGEPIRAQQMIKRWMQFPNLRAVKNKQARMIHDDALFRPTLRLLEGLKRFSEMIYDQK